MKYLIILAALLSLNGCFYYTVWPETYIKAEQVCKANDGVKWIEVDSVRAEVRCYNNAVFTIPKKAG